MHENGRVCQRMSVTLKILRGHEGLVLHHPVLTKRVSTSLGLWEGAACKALCNEAEFTTEEVDVLTGPDRVSWVWRIAVQLLDMVPNRGAYVVGKSEVVEGRSPWIKVFCDRHLSDELAFPDMQEEKRRGCRGKAGELTGRRREQPTYLLDGLGVGVGCP